MNKQDSAPTKLAYTVRNPHSFPVCFNEQSTPFRRGHPFLEVSLNGEEIPYRGVLRYPTDLKDIHLAPGQSITVHFDVNNYYNLSLPGEYTIIAREGPMIKESDYVPLEAFLSINLESEGKKGFLSWRNFAFWQKPREARIPQSNQVILTTSSSYSNDNTII